MTVRACADARRTTAVDEVALSRGSSACATCFTRLWENPPDEMTTAVTRFEQPAPEVVAACGGVRPAEPGVGFAPAGAACGLSGVTLVTNDAHTGLVAAIEATVPGAAWQRCTTRCAVHLMSSTHKSSWLWVRTPRHSIFDQDDTECVVAQYNLTGIDALVW
jgi:hypothetical protein